MIGLSRMRENSRVSSYIHLNLLKGLFLTCLFAIVEGTDLDANVTIDPCLTPMSKTAFSIHWPFQHAWVTGYSCCVGCFGLADGVNRTVLQAFLTFLAILLYSEVNRLVRLERKVCKHFAESNPWPILRCDQQPVSSQLTQPCVDGEWNTQCSIVAAWKGLVTQIPNKLGIQMINIKVLISEFCFIKCRASIMSVFIDMPLLTCLESIFIERSATITARKLILFK